MNLAARFAFRMIASCLVGTCPCYAGSHPVRLDENSNCLECHADHATGDHVHPAVTLGCASCHSIENRDDQSYVVLKSSKGVACFECHQPATLAYSHLPYTSGMCTRCHDPHVSANPQLLLAKVNVLCLSCHLRHASERSIAVYADDRTHGQQQHGTPLRAPSRERKPRSPQCHLRMWGLEGASQRRHKKKGRGELCGDSRHRLRVEHSSTHSSSQLAN